MNATKRAMYIIAGLIAFFLLAACIWLLITVDDWSRDLTKNQAATSTAAKNPNLRPIQTDLPPAELAKLVITAASQLPGWEFASQDELDSGITLRFVRTTKLMRFKDDITVQIRPIEGKRQQQRYEVSAESRSRVGKGDFGQNPRNLRELMDKVHDTLP